MTYRREIDGLRAVALLPVVCFHAGISTFRGGYVGVDVFFVISGYLISTLILRDLDQGTFGLAAFYERRARRILPALFLMVVACIAASWVWLLPDEMRAISRSFVTVPVFATNLLFARDDGYFGSTADVNPLLHTWSLSIEEQFYLVYPPILMVACRHRRRSVTEWLVLATCLSLATSYLIAKRYTDVAFLMLPTRAWEITCGACVGSTLLGRPVSGPREDVIAEIGSLAGLVMIAAGVLAFDETSTFPGLNGIFATAGAALVIVYASPQTLTGRLLGSKPLVGVGLISYSGYLWHQPIFAFARLRGADLMSPLTITLLALLTLCVSAASWMCVERPARLPGVIKRKPLVVGAVAIGSCVIMIGLAGYTSDGFPARLSRDARKVAATRGVHLRLRDDSGCNSFGGAVKGCVKGDAAHPPKYALVGDSVATTLAHELAVALRAKSESFIQYTLNGCPVAFGLVGTRTDECRSFQKLYLADARTRSVDTFVVSSMWSYYALQGQYFQGASRIESDGTYASSESLLTATYGERRDSVLALYVDSVQQLLSSGYSVILVYPIPEQAMDVPSVLARSLWANVDAPASLATTVEAFRRRNSAVVTALDSIGDHVGLTRVFPERELCDTVVRKRCAAVIGRAPLYYDNYHLSNEGAAMIVQALMRERRRAEM